MDHIVHMMTSHCDTEAQRVERVVGVAGLRPSLLSAVSVKHIINNIINNITNNIYNV